MSPVVAATPHRVFDAVTYAVGVTALAVLMLLPLSLLLGTGLRGLKFGLFVIGFLSMGYATFRLRPPRPDKATEASTPRSETDLEARFGRLPGLHGHQLPVEERFSPGAKLFLASLTMLAVSYLMESALHVR